MAKDRGQTATSLGTCASCKCDVGKEAGKIPFLVDDHAGQPVERAKHEAFCPRCFVYVRSLREPDRFRPGCFTAVHCSSCKCESVAIGIMRCSGCGNMRGLVELPPQPGLVT